MKTSRYFSSEQIIFIHAICLKMLGNFKEAEWVYKKNDKAIKQYDKQKMINVAIGVIQAGIS